MNKYHLSTLLLLTFVTSCGENISPVDSGLEKQIFHFGNGAEPQGLDPHIVTGVPEHHILIALCEGLTSPNPKGGNPMPGMAESWSLNEDGTVYTFKINQNAKWSNGDEVIAYDFFWSW